MTKNYQKNIWLFILLAMALAGMGYALDSDPAYPELSTSLIEFAIITTIIFGILSALYFVGSFLKKSMVK